MISILKMKLYKHQKELLELNPKKHLLAWECGTGKTLAAIELAQANGKEILVVCPKSIKQQWEEQVSKHWTVLTKEEFKKQHLTLERHDVVVIDESHFFHGMTGFRKKSAMLKTMLEYLKKHNIENIYMLTATPYLSTPYNLYAVGEILGHRMKFKEFKNHFFVDVNMGMRWPVPVVKKNIEKDIAKLVNIFGNTVKMDDCFDVPEQIFQTEYFELTKEQKKAIDELDDEGIARWTRSHCIENGLSIGDGYIDDKYYKSEKTQRILELCDQHKKLAIVARYNLQLYLYRDLLEKKGKKVFIINGASKNKNDNIKEINNIEECVVLIQGSVSEGYELWSVPIMIFASLDFSLKNLIQVKGRILRSNHLKKNVYIYMVGKKGTVDYSVYDNVVNKKQDFQIAIFKHPC